jgi:DNA polymerase
VNAIAEPAEPAEPGRAELYRALETIEDSLSSGMRLHRAPEDFVNGLEQASQQARKVAAERTEPPQGRVGAPVDERDAAQAPAPELEVLLAGLERRAAACTACALAAGRNRSVFGQGVPDPLVLVVGEGPGAEEDQQGLPFVGPSGRLLDKMLAAIGLSRQTNCYIANIVKCRPPNNREPAPDERRACMPFLEEQIRLLAPKAILCAGRTAAQSLLATTDGINKLRTTLHRLGDIPVVATFHPSALLRDETLKRPAWEDLKRLRELLPHDR